MELFNQFFKNKTNKEESNFNDDEMIQLPKLSVLPIKLTVEMQMRKREEELCRRYKINVPRNTEMIN